MRPNWFRRLLAWWIEWRTTRQWIRCYHPGELTDAKIRELVTQIRGDQA